MATIGKIRRLYHKERLSKRAIAKKLNLNRRTVDKHLQSVDPPIYKRRQTHYPKLGPHMDKLIQRIVSEELSGIQHFEWLRSEGYDGRYGAVAEFIRKYREQHPCKPVQVFIPQSFSAGDAYQFDWSAEVIRLAGKEQRVQIAHFRLCHSRAFYIRAYFRQKLEMLIDAHNQAFSFWGGIPQRGIYDNMKSVVAGIGQGKERTFNKHFLSMMNHFMVEPVACAPVSGWKKGQVERQIGILRQRLFKPVLSFESLGALN
jgi:transposase